MNTTNKQNEKKNQQKTRQQGIKKGERHEQELPETRLTR